jgi:lysophospholipase L1-like esterase
MRSVLVYGDSQSWGRVPGVPERLPYEQRWTSVLAAGLAGEAHVIVEALNGRTTCRDEPWKPWRNGLAHLDLQLASHAPLDLVILALGCNDLQWHQHLGAYESMLGMQALVEKVVAWRGEPAGPAPKAMILAPPRITQPAGPLVDKFRGAIEKSEEQQRLYRRLAGEMGVAFASMADVGSPSAIDGIHLDADGQRRLGLALVPQVRVLLGVVAQG